MTGFCGGPILRIKISAGLSWGPAIHGNYHVRQPATEATPRLALVAMSGSSPIRSHHPQLRGKRFRFGVYLEAIVPFKDVLFVTDFDYDNLHSCGRKTSPLN